MATERDQCHCGSYYLESWPGVWICPTGCDEHLIDDEDLDPEITCE